MANQFAREISSELAGNNNHASRRTLAWFNAKECNHPPLQCVSHSKSGCWPNFLNLPCCLGVDRRIARHSLASLRLRDESFQAVSSCAQIFTPTKIPSGGLSKWLRNFWRLQFVVLLSVPAILVRGLCERQSETASVADAISSPFSSFVVGPWGP